MVLGDRSRGDGCPGAIRMHQATDGYIGRVRFPGGFITAAEWDQLAAISAEFGDGDIHLTTRGNVQMRGVADQEGLSAHLDQLGWIPSRAHDKMRNIITEPLLPEWGAWAKTLDAALRAEPGTAGLSGRTLFALDEGAGRVSRFRPDFGLQRHPQHAGHPARQNDHAYLIIGGRLFDAGHTLATGLGAVVALAAAWAEIRGDNWRVRERDTAPAELLAHLGIDAQEIPTPADTHTRPIGWFEIDAPHGAGDEDITSPQAADIDDPATFGGDPARRVSLGVGVPFGRVTAAQARLLGAVGYPTTVTAWPSITIHGLHEAEADAVVKVLAPAGFVFHQDSPQVRVTACTGLPGCEKSATDVRRDAWQLMADPALMATSTEEVFAEAGREAPADGDLLVHFSGCARRCGHPGRAHVEFLAEGEGEYTTQLRP
ncbi:precorrin-3B synthase [Corynebacterium sp. 13CS0277]|nr:precorrin-3B synthase [Corynebacterium sp. 13CS0277]